MTRLRPFLPLLLALCLAPALRAVTDLVVPRSSNTVLRAGSPAGPWEAVATFPGAAPATNLWLAGSATNAFFRVRSEQW